MKIELDKIVESPHQVRKVFDDEELKELAESIKNSGLLQPIKVRPLGKESYELVYGHRRVAAMRLLGWTKCESIVEDVSNHESLVQSLVENLQRQNLDILDEAHSYQTLVDSGYSLRDISELVKKPQGRISNRLSILRLPPKVQELVRPRKGQHDATTEHGGLSPDSASRIAAVAKEPNEAKKLAQKVIEERMNSLEIRELTRKLKVTTDQSKRNQLIQGGDVNTGHDNRIKTNFHVPHFDSYSDRIHRKILWNIRRMDIDQFNHFTIGYSERSVDQFIELLHMAKIEILADVRFVPISQFKPEFSKSNLRKSLAKNEIRYVHWPELGIPPEIRRSVQNEDLFLWYDSNVQIEALFAQLDIKLSNQRIAFMCTEVAPQNCHRHRIAAYIEQLGYRVLDL